MRKKIIRRVFIMGMLLLLGCVVVACSDKGKEITCTLAIYTDEAVILEEVNITFNEGQTVLDILKKATRDAEVPMEYTGIGAAVYVKGIDNVYEFDKGPESGWIYSVNGEVCAESAGAVKPGEGDAVVWQYVLES